MKCWWRWTSKNRGPRSPWFGSRVVSLFFLALAILLSGCVTPRAQGDHALEMGDYALAQRFYEEAIEDGDRDPDLYYRAALTAQHQGAFAEAERYFSQSLRYGGGREVAIALAEFYVQTSNFIEAVRVYQYLLRFEENVQPVYNNIGTSLMYGGKYIDAESYLLLAQQMDPKDPVPYLNLGALYDYHIRNRPRAIRFYECYLALSPNESQETRQVATRLHEFSFEGQADTSRVNLTCGEVYRPGVQPRHDLQAIFDLEFGEEDTETSQEPTPIIVERFEQSGGDELEANRSTEDADVEELRAQGEAYLSSGHFDRAAEVLSQIPPLERSDQDQGALGQAYYQIGRFDEAAQQFEGLLEARPTPERVEFLLKIYGKLQREEERNRLCERFEGWPDFEDVLSSCQDE